MTSQKNIAIVKQPVVLPFTTEDELEFIAGMQTDKNGTLANKLHGYLAGCEKRVRWGRIDKNAAIAAAHVRLAEIAEPVAA